MADKETQLTPMDIHNKEFKTRGRNGYDRYEVDNFLDQIVDNYGDALDENADLKNEIIYLNKKINELQTQINKLDKRRISLNKSIISDQHTIDTEKDAVKDSYDQLREQIGSFRLRIQKMLQVEIDNLNNEEWQHLLGQYFHTVYSHSNVDNDSKNDVNFSQGLNDEMINSTSKSVTADDLNHKTISTRNGTNKVNPTIVFPDNNEK